MIPRFASHSLIESPISVEGAFGSLVAFRKFPILNIPKINSFTEKESSFMVSAFKAFFRREKKTVADTPATGTPEASAYNRSLSNVPDVTKNLRSLVEGRNLQVSDFDLRATVGTGTFGRVRIVKLKHSADRTPFALKMLKKSEVIRLKQVQHVKAEKDILMMIDHPFIVTLVAAFQDAKRLYMLMEYVNGGELFSHLRKEGRLSIDAARFYTAEIVLAFQYLHERNIVYRDLKPENLLLDSRGHIKITDFGFAKIVDSRTWTLCGTPEYLAPEIIQSKGHSKGVDYWALGILLYEMVAGFPPFYDENPFGIYQKILNGKVDFPSKYFDENTKSLITKLLVSDPTKRLGCLAGKTDDIKKHKFFKNLDWNSLFAKSPAICPPFVPPVKALDDCSMFDKYPETVDNCLGITAREQLDFEDF